MTQVKLSHPADHVGRSPSPAWVGLLLQPNREELHMDLPGWVIGLLVVLLIALIGVFFWQRKKARDDE